MSVTVILGKNGSGKTQYVDNMRKQLSSDSVRYVAFRDSYGASVDHAYYLQLRWNQHDIDAETPDVKNLLEKTFLITGADTKERRDWQRHLYDLFDMSPLLAKYIITLSSGELRKFQLTRTLLARPKTLIIDNPFVGLDSNARELLNQLIQKLSGEQNMEIFLVLSRRSEIPDNVAEIIEIGDFHENNENRLSEDKRNALLNLPYSGTDYQAEEVIAMRNVSIRYGSRIILKDLNWTVKNGERWALGGQNGSGKSTLLSLVCADNPQSYACDIALFGHQRGSGESIWDIKKHIGYVSPEMHRSYHRNIPAIQIVASGLKDTVGLYVRANEAEKEQCRWWLDLFGILHLADRSFLQMSSGEQRLVLLARAFVKNPELLILDEPLHGLDAENRQLVKDIIETFCQRRNKTMIMVTHYEEELPPCINQKLYLKRN